MADKSGQRFEIPKKSSLVAELFTTQEQRDDDKREKVQDIPLSELDAFPDHPFQVKMDEAKKKELFAKVRKGQVRVMLGSTQKMGAGTNCQDRLIALHDLDCPWRPADVGRVLRTTKNRSYNTRLLLFLFFIEKKTPSLRASHE